MLGIQKRKILFWFPFYSSIDSQFNFKSLYFPSSQLFSEVSNFLCLPSHSLGETALPKPHDASLPIFIGVQNMIGTSSFCGQGNVGTERLSEVYHTVKKW